MNKRKVLLVKVKHYIDTELNPASKNIIDNSKDDYEQVTSTDEILCDLDITKSEYENAQMRRLPNSCFVDNYSADGLIV